jgi:hypothetical protein
VDLVEVAKQTVYTQVKVLVVVAILVVAVQTAQLLGILEVVEVPSSQLQLPTPQHQQELLTVQLP